MTNSYNYFTVKKANINLIETPLDYSKSENWFVKQSNGKNKVDLIYFMPTTTDTKYKQEIYPVDDFVRNKSWINLNKIDLIFSQDTNIYIPFTRQISHCASIPYVNNSVYDEKIFNSIVKSDAYAVLDYYFKYYNNGKPFILSGLCQGGGICKAILSEYMKLHPDYYSRMIAAYLPGTCINKNFLKDNPHIKVAKGETDTGVVISWNTEGPNAKKPNIFLFDSPYCINPLNWKTDSTYADISMNHGSLDWKNHKIIDGVADGYINKDRHVIITATVQAKGFKPYPYENFIILGDQSFHLYEWDFFAVNIKENVQKRINEWFLKNKKEK